MSWFEFSSALSAQASFPSAVLYRRHFRKTAEDTEDFAEEIKKWARTEKSEKRDYDGVNANRYAEIRIEFTMSA